MSSDEYEDTIEPREQKVQVQKAPGAGQADAMAKILGCVRTVLSTGVYHLGVTLPPSFLLLLFLVKRLSTLLFIADVNVNWLPT